MEKCNYGNQDQEEEECVREELDPSRHRIETEEWFFED